MSVAAAEPDPDPELDPDPGCTVGSGPGLLGAVGHFFGAAASGATRYTVRLVIT